MERAARSAQPPCWQKHTNTHTLDETFGRFLGVLSRYQETTGELSVLVSKLEFTDTKRTKCIEVINEAQMC